MAGRAEELPDGGFPKERIFCLIGTNPENYDVAMGLSAAAVGAKSDGLVQIEKAYIPARGMRSCSAAIVAPTAWSTPKRATRTSGASFEEYGQWHLVLTDGASDQTKARYAFVYGDFRQHLGKRSG